MLTIDTAQIAALAAERVKETQKRARRARFLGELQSHLDEEARWRRLGLLAIQAGLADRDELVLR